jgi:hypothetical protein
MESNWHNAMANRIATTDWAAVPVERLAMWAITGYTPMDFNRAAVQELRRRVVVCLAKYMGELRALGH